MLMTKLHIIILSLVCLVIFSSTGQAAVNFWGAIIELKDVPTSAWRYGVLGNKLIVTMVNDNSKAKQSGFKLGDIILSLDGKDVVLYKDLIELSDGKHTINVLNKKYQVQSLVIDISSTKIHNIKQKNNDSNLPPIAVNDDVLAGKYGKSDVNSKKKKRTYQECMDDELANANTYEFYLNKPNARGGDYGRAQRICDEEFGRRTGISVERLY